MNVDKADFLSPVTSQNFLSGGDGVQTQLLCRAARRQPRRWPCSCLQIGVFSGGGEGAPSSRPLEIEATTRWRFSSGDTLEAFPYG